jgi:pyruvate/2-oxoglutarate dehydrogenase complex dihydrolipoamide acyltransferase (E2) component
MGNSASPHTLAPSPAVAPGGEEEIVPLTRARRLLAEHMVRSKQGSPHVATVAEVDMTEVVALHAQCHDKIREREGVTLTYLPFVLKAAAEALTAYPILNAQRAGDAVHIKKYVNLGITVAREDIGLVVPVIRQAQVKSVLALAREVEDLTARARANRLRGHEVRGATFSVTETAAPGILLQTPVIHQPQAAILGINPVFKTAAVVNDEIAIRSMMYLCLSHDGGIVDGDTAIRFLQDIKRSLEETRFLFT